MKRIIFLMALLLASLPSFAQIMSFDMLKSVQNTKVKLTLQDSKSSEPIQWATVYLVPVGDTTITHFALSDHKGDVMLEEVGVGKYELNAEIIGYYPHKKTYDIKYNWNGFDLGIIKMEENPEYIDASTISAVGNPITIKKDTIEFNASSFKVGENAMLEDLLKKMPGIEVGDNGTVTINGEEVSKITVGGKTFFFDDPTAALKNLPAKIVDKIKVIDKTKDEATGSAIVRKDDKEKVMDVALKEEYTKGWFGNAKIGGGSTLTPKTDDKLIDDRNLLYNSNAMVTGYTDMDQFTFIGNAHNALEPGVSLGFVYYAGTDMSEKNFNNLGGLGTTAQAGLNYNTSRIKGMESTATVNYKNNGKVDRERTSRTSLQQEGGDILTESEYDASGSQNVVSGSLEIKSKENDKYNLTIRPSAGFTSENISSYNRSETSGAEGSMNSSEANTYSDAKQIFTRNYVSANIMNMGKEKRNLRLYMAYNLFHTDRNTKEISNLMTAGNTTVKDLLYKINNNNYNINGGLEYSEPLAERWVAQVRFSTEYSVRENTKDAANPDGSANDYYSSVSNNYYTTLTGQATVQYSDDINTLQLGVRPETVKNVIHSKSLGVETVTGKDEWLFNMSPYVSYQYMKGSSNLYVDYSGYTNQPTGSQINPTLDISDPVQISAGNIYLNPSFRHMLYSSYRINNRETFAFLNVSLSGSLVSNSTVSASWFDNQGVRYSIPVNSKKPQSNGRIYLTYNRPFGKARNFTLTASGNASYNGSHSYQAVSRLEGMNLNDFDYNEFMRGFWGNADGDIFYSGKSGFAESKTNTYNWGGSLKLKYSIEKLDATLSANVSNRISKYSLDKSADINTWNNNLGLNVLYKPGKGWEFDTDLNYMFYRGYSYGFGAPEWNWDITLRKSIKTVTLGLVVADVLNQTRNLQRTVSEDYVEDVYSNILGRFFMFNVQFNFGKMNAKKNRNIQRAMMNMM